VGALAARRAKEKASDRRKRMSLDKAPHTLSSPTNQSSFSSLKELYGGGGSALSSNTSGNTSTGAAAMATGARGNTGMHAKLASSPEFVSVS
jgi:hypothetical protein